MKINNVEYDLEELLKHHRVNSVEAAQALQAATGVTFYEAVRILENYNKGIPIDTPKKINVKKFLPLIAILAIIVVVLVCVNLGDNQSKLNENIKVAQSSWISENVWTEYEHIGFMIENNNNEAVDVLLTIKCYDENGGYTETQKKEAIAVAPKSKFFFDGKLGDKVKKVKYDYECSKSSYQSLDESELKVSTIEKETKLRISAKNNSSKDTSGCICTVVFYDKKHEIMSAETLEIHNGKIPAGETVKEEINRPLLSESVEIFTNAYVR